MKSENLSTVTFCVSVPLRVEGDREIMKDTIQTYHDQTEAMIKVIIAKHPGVHLTVERQSRRLDRLPKIEIGESMRAIKRYAPPPPEERAKLSPAVKPIVRATEKTSSPKSADYGSLVTEMMKDAS